MALQKTIRVETVTVVGSSALALYIIQEVILSSHRWSHGALAITVHIGLYASIFGKPMWYGNGQMSGQGIVPFFKLNGHAQRVKIKCF